MSAAACGTDCGARGRSSEHSSGVTLKNAGGCRGSTISASLWGRRVSKGNCRDDQQSTSDALQILEYTKKACAPILKKLIASAVANARQRRPDVDVDTLYISKAAVDKGPNSHMRRWRPRAMGRATRVVKGISHIQIELDQR